VIGLNQPFSEVLRNNFLIIEDIYDTELFLPTPYDILQIGDEYLEELIKVQGPAHPTVYKKIGHSGQQSLDDRGVYGYNFKTLTIDVMGSAYERYLAHKISTEKGRIVIEETEKLRKKEGIYYTPPYVVDYIVKKTVIPIVKTVFQEASLIEEFYRRQLKNKGLAGPFLMNDLKIEPIGEKILLDNIYGIDLDPQAVEITKLNLWLKMLSLDPLSYKPAIGKKQRKLLPSLVTNIKQGNSLFSGFEKATDIDRSKLEEVAKLRQRLHEQILLMGPTGKLDIYERDQLRSDFEKLLTQENEIRCELNRIANESLKESFDSKEGSFIGLKGQPFNWEIEFPELFLTNNPGFDIILGNPPHGAELSQEERGFIEQNYDTGKGYKNTAFLFIERSLSKLRRGGRLGFVIPKSLTFAQEWRKVRNLLLDNFSIEEIADISKAFKGVLLEQVVLLVSNSCEQKPIFKGHYLGPTSRPDSEFNEIPFSLCKEIDAFPIHANEKSRSIYDKIKKISIPLGNISKTFRGLPLQSKLKKAKGIFDEEALIGDDIARYSFREPRKFLPTSLLEREKVDLMRRAKIISQRIVAHVTRPVDHIILMSTLDERGLVNVDTVENTIIEDATYDPKHILALVNSRLIGWLTYVFIYNKAVRTMDFDGYYVGKIPVAEKLREKDATLSNLVSDMLVLCRQKHHLILMFKNLLANLNITREEKLSFYLSSPKIAEAHGINLSETSRIAAEETGVIERYHVKLDGNFIVIGCELREEETLDVIRLKFEYPVLRDYFYMALRDYAGVRNYKKPRRIYDATVAAMPVPRFAGSNLIEDNPEAIRQLMSILKKEIEKIKDSFSGSPVPTADFATIDQKIAEANAAIDKKIFQIYRLSEDEIALIKRETVSLANTT